MDMLAANWLRGGIMVLIIGVCCLLMLVILLQKGRGEGLSGAFGGGGGSSAFGTKTGDMFTWITVCLAAVFLLLACVGIFVFEPTDPNAALAAVTPTEADAPPADGDGDTEQPADTAPTSFQYGAPKPADGGDEVVGATEPVEGGGIEQPADPDDGTAGGAAEDAPAKPETPPAGGEKDGD